MLLVPCGAGILWSLEVLDYGFEDAETRFDSLQVHKTFLSLLCSDGIRGPTQLPIQWVKAPHYPGKSIRGVKPST